MLNYATSQDIDFIVQLILLEAENGIFSKELLGEDAAYGLKAQITTIITHRRKIDGTTAYALIKREKNVPIGFIVISSNPMELWMVAIDPKYRGLGLGERMVLEFLNQMIGKNIVLVARCSEQSEIMFHILTKHGFCHKHTDKEGYRGLAYTL